MSQKRPNLAQNMHFWSFGPNIGLYSPFGGMPGKKNNTNEDLGVGTDGEAFFTGRGKAKKITDGAHTAYIS